MDKSLKVGIHMNTLSPTDRAKRELYKSFAKGVQAAGDTIVIVNKGYDIKGLNGCDVVVVWGAVRNHKGTKKEMQLKQEIITRHKRNGLIVLDNPIIRRTINYKRNTPTVNKPTGTEYVRVGVDSFLANDGKFNNANVSNDRWKKFNISHSPWRTTGTHILIVLQKLFDASLGGIEEERPSAHIQWLYDSICNIRKYSDRKIVVRCHPLSLNDKREMAYLKNISVSEYADVTLDHTSKRSIAQDLIDCWAVVTFTSGSCYDALIKGIPVITCNKGSLAWDITEHTFERIESLPLPDISAWLAGLSYVEWNITEIKEGLPWKHLKPVILKQLKK